MRCEVLLACEDQPERQQRLRLEALASEPLSRLLWLSGVLKPRALCAGLGQCGRCRVRFLGEAPAGQSDEEQFFSEEELALGWRLSCRHTLAELAGCCEPHSLLLPAHSLAQKRELCEPRPRSKEKLLLALDLGTSSVCWQLLQKASGRILAEGQFLNPQAVVGSDVISRLAYARQPAKRKQLATLVREALVRELGCHAELAQIDLVCLAANTAMTEIFLDNDVQGLCAAPYRLCHQGHEIVSLPDFPAVYLPPLPGPFLGGDVTAGLAEVLSQKPGKPWLLVDLGTNAEFALMADELYFASVPMGPAMEGIGMRCGQLASDTVITAFTLGPEGLVGHCPKSGARPSGISATGYLALLALLLRTGLVRADGHFQSVQSMPILRKISARFVQKASGTRLELANGLFLEARDGEELLKVKAAFASALTLLLKAAGCRAEALQQIFLAGALGRYAEPRDLETLAFFPRGTASKILPCGNTALLGAARLARSAAWREELSALCQKAKVLTVTNDRDFQASFFAAMGFGQGS